ncbi:hypothetical protein LS48_02305 [Aequorivita aquimaris]|uniref:Lipoprotein n=1 Tax=Aequorivita aquimaris TaxID=1548749 RepID=A0A137RM90_9FLAO|nr:hypothetical protein [Aequorivita aquimaris]KXO01312.1 hypothetical protein LS48_02305 [Aequorivita aquimaris]MDX1782923.1 hypothetical protein [Aequorivita vladivostokensis]
MKKIILVMVSLFVLSCATENKQEDVVRELAKKDAIEKLQLPEGTKFSDENIEVTETKAESGTLGVTYLVKVTIKSQDREGNEVIKTHTFNYKKTGESGSNASDYELTSFE